MRKHYTPIRNKIILSAGFILLMTLPAVVSAQQTFKLTSPVTSMPFNLNSGTIRLATPNVTKQLAPRPNLIAQFNQTLLNLSLQNKPDSAKGHQATVIYPDGKTVKITIASSVKYATLDHMPILTPDMSRYNIPTIGSLQLDHPNPK